MYKKRSNTGEIEERIFSTFAGVASTIGYSPLHGKIIGALLVKGKPVSLQELARETGYSSSTISLSLDFLELLGVIKRVKIPTDRRLFISLQGDLLEALKKGMLIRIKKSVSDSFQEFEEMRQKLRESGDGGEKKRLIKTIGVLEREIKRLDRYLDLLSDTRLP